MTRDEFKENLRRTVREYLASEESYDDDALLVIDKNTLALTLADGEESDQYDEDTRFDTYNVMDLVEMDSDGKWIPSEEALAEVAADYAE